MQQSLKWIAAVMLAMVSAQSYAVLMLTPAGATATTGTNSNLGSLAAINAAFGTSYTGLTLGYKDNVGGAEEGPLAGSYNTVFSNSAADPADADLSYGSGASFSCPACILIVKGGNHTPAQYLFDLGSWNGTESLQLRGFWPQRGAISNIAIWSGGTNTQVPEPGSLGLLGVALLALGFRHRARAI